MFLLIAGAIKVAVSRRIGFIRQRKLSLATVPSSKYSPNQSLSAQVKLKKLETQVMNRTSAQWERLTREEADLLVGEALLLGNLSFAFSIVKSIVLVPNSPIRLVLEPLKHILLAAAQRHDLEVGDLAIGVALSAPAELLDSRLVSLYVELLAGLEVSITF